MPEKNKHTIINTGSEIRHILADISIAEKHPKTVHGGPETTITRRVASIVHSAILSAGRLANQGIERKTPTWPINAETINVLGYGQEKIAYKITTPNQQTSVVSVYHRQALAKDPFEVAQQKADRYSVYKKYFEDLVLPTVFTVIDNPWGSGGKPASIAPFVESTGRFGDLNIETVRQQAEKSPSFAASLTRLEGGYQAMRHDGIIPDLASSNVLLTDSGITIIDTGTLHTPGQLPMLRNLHPIYRMLDELPYSIMEK